MITIICSTNRPDSYSLKICHWLNNHLTNRGITSQILNISEFPDDFSTLKIKKLACPVFDKIVLEKIQNVNKFIFVIPEYNGSFPGILKTMVDSTPPRYFHNKRASLVGISSGRSGALRAMDDFTGVLHYLQVEVLSDKPKIGAIESVINPQNEIQNEDIVKRLSLHIEKFLSF